MKLKSTLSFLFIIALPSLGILLFWLSPSTPPQADMPDVSSYPWIYLRQNRPIDKSENSVELVLVGDIFLGRGVDNPVHALDSMVPILRSADLTVGNFEGVIDSSRRHAPRGQSAPGKYPISLVQPATASAILNHAGFDILSLANNHALDLGAAGLADTVDLLELSGLEPIGVLNKDKTLPQPLIKNVGGLRIAFLAFNAIPFANSKNSGQSPEMTIANWQPEMAIAAIQNARQRADFIIVSMHWGYEYQSNTDPAQREIANMLIEAGADLVFGHHPHVVQDYAIIHPAKETPRSSPQLVAYSLGNFVFDQQFDETKHGLLLRVFIDKAGLRAVQALPVRAGLQPKLMSSKSESGPLSQSILPSTRIGFLCHDTVCEQIPIANDYANGRFYSGAIDLTGDGVEELVRLNGKAVSIYQDGVKVWESPEEWQVLDLALGDPNNDGRGELLLALFKADKDGILHSHPFIVGYRGGTYRLLWGGSAVSDPIVELELGDVNGDNAPELILIEDLSENENKQVSIWQWHGWGFSQIWHSGKGNYSDLALGKDETTSSISFSVTINTTP
jgi:poly-gamma-glutamate synthesis protein (capsule biosynthesis protein)